MKASKFFNKREGKRIVDSIRKAEETTNAEIRLHLDTHCEGETLQRAREVFEILHMQDTENKNGVLVYIAIEDKKVAIIGDSGIDRLTPEGYWQKELDRIIEFFVREEFVTGIVSTISSIGTKLATHFPIKEGDLNELSDEISFYDN